mmetsp:Transcript_42346/g.135588  ORF Transcript_42346/g.135588 Transcript_42346/m.135588 type:complete len:348 (-) Transcript_42346:415-1458(-)
MGSKQAPTEDIRDSVPALAENLCGLQSVAKVQLTLTKSEAAHYLWALAVQSNARKIEIAKANCLGYLVTLVGNGSQEGKYNAVGCLQHLTKCEDIRPDIIYNLAGVKQLTSIAKLLTGPHDRSRVCAAILLNQLSLIPEFSKMTVAIPYLVELLGITEPDWAGISVARSNAAVCLRNLAVTKELRMQIYKDGGIPNLINMLGGGGNSIEGRTAAVSCLNILAEDDTGIQGLLKGNAIPALCRILEQPHNMDTIESKANAAGCLWNIVLEERTRMQVAREGGVPHLVMLLKGLAGEGGGKAKKKGKGKKDPPLPPAVDMAQRNAAGTIWHLSFSDENKVGLAIDTHKP